MKLTGSQIVVECLKEQGVDTVFGYPGGAILNIYDELYRHSDEIFHVLSSHEQGASHMADGYARSTGKVGVCLATSGPGATNLVTGIATAYMDSIPMVAITANVASPLLGRDSFQEVDIVGITMPVTKHNYLVKDVHKLADTIREAFRIAVSGRPGPVLIDITKDVTAAHAEYEPKTPLEPLPLRFRGESSPDKDIREALLRAKKPVLFIGGGAVLSDACEVLKEFAEKYDLPVADTLMGKGAFDGASERYLNMVGMHGSKVANYAVSHADLLIAVGVRFSDRVYGNAKHFAPHARILHIDIDAAEINKNIGSHLSMIAPAKEAMERLSDMVDQTSHKEWMDEIYAYREAHPLRYNPNVLTGPYVIECLSRLTKGRAVISTDVGQHQMWAAQFYEFRNNRSFLTSGGLGTMGYGLGAAIGAKVGCPDLPVINITGDGCFRMNMTELMTASRFGIPVIDIVMNNRVLGMVRQWQTLFYGKRYSHTVLEDHADFVKIAEGMGCRAIRITTKEEVLPALEEALKSDRPVVLDVELQKDDMVYPMVAPGESLDRCFSEEDLDERG